MLPQHRQKWTVSGSKLGAKQLSASISPPFRYGGYSQSGGRIRESVGHIEVMDRSGMFVSRPGQITVTLECGLDGDEVHDLRFSPQVAIEISLPVDRTSRSSHLRADFVHVIGSEEPKPEEGDDMPHTARQLVAFRFGE